MAETLLPCPFCGGEPHVVPTHVSGGAEFAEVVCYDCYASVPCEREFATEGESVHSAAIAWNRRAERTCRYERTHRGVAKNWFRACSECGAEFDGRVVGRHYRYCPNCGARVVDE